MPDSSRRPRRSDALVRDVARAPARAMLKATGLDEHNHPLYALPDVAKAERATRSRALRLVGIAKASQNGHLAITGHTPGA